MNLYMVSSSLWSRRDATGPLDGPVDTYDAMVIAADDARTAAKLARAYSRHWPKERNTRWRAELLTDPEVPVALLDTEPGVVLASFNGG